MTQQRICGGDRVHKRAIRYAQGLSVVWPLYVVRFFPALALSAAAAFASSISIVNPSLQILPAGGLNVSCINPGCFYNPNGDISGWVTSAGSQGDFDQVGLDVTPEPTSLTMFGLGLVDIGAVLKRRGR